jgi:hypothetical protein
LQHLLHRAHRSDSVKIALELIEMPVCRAIEISSNGAADFASSAFGY